MHALLFLDAAVMGRGFDSITFCSCAKLWPRVWQQRRGRETHSAGGGVGGSRREVHWCWRRFRLLCGPKILGKNSNPAIWLRLKKPSIWTYDSLSHRSCRSSRGIRRTATRLAHTSRQHTWSFQECCTLWWCYCLAAVGSLMEKKEQIITNFIPDNYHIHSPVKNLMF